MTRLERIALALAGVALAAAVCGAQEARVTLTITPPIDIPRSIRAEHEAIHAQLIDATREEGRVGAAAQALARVLHPHFVREEQIALPPLGALAALARNETIPQATAILAMTDSLRVELPGMLEEHVRIRAAVQELREAATIEGNETVERLADQLALHALTEEEVLYPAAIVVGDLLRVRPRARPIVP